MAWKRIIHGLERALILLVSLFMSAIGGCREQQSAAATINGSETGHLCVPISSDGYERLAARTDRLVLIVTSYTSPASGSGDLLVTAPSRSTQPVETLATIGMFPRSPGSQQQEHRFLIPVRPDQLDSTTDALCVDVRISSAGEVSAGGNASIRLEVQAWR